MKASKLITLFISIALLLGACEPEPLDIEIPQADPKLVVYSQALPEQGLIVALTKSFAALSLPNEIKDSTKQDSLNNVFLNQFLVENATVYISGADFNDTLDEIAKGIYAAPFFPSTTNLTYNLSAFDPNTSFTVNATTTALPVVQFDSVFAYQSDPDDSSFIKINYYVNDPLGDNYYLLTVYSDTIPESNFFSFGGSENFNSIAFSDREYPQGQLQDEQTFEVGESDSVVVTLTNISRDFFDYVKARERSDNSFLSEPVTYPSNVENGLGFFNIHLPSARVVKVER